MKPLVQLCITIVLICISHAAIAADTIIVKKDPRIDILTAKQVQANKRTTQLTSKGTYKGFRVQVFSARNRVAAFDLKNALQAGFPDQKSYVMYQSPNFKVRIGNFIRREDAEDFRRQLLKTYPDGLYIVEDTVDYTPSEEEDVW